MNTLRAIAVRSAALLVMLFFGLTVALLLSRGADVNANTDTALTFAQNKGRSEIAALLRQAGAMDAP
jgi:ankyrin repeat protein